MGNGNSRITKELFERLDKDGSGKVGAPSRLCTFPSRDCFPRTFYVPIFDASAQASKRTFHHFLTLTRPQLEMRELKALVSAFSDEKTSVESLVAKLDKDGDQSVSADELAAILQDNKGTQRTTTQRSTHAATLEEPSRERLRM